MHVTSISHGISEKEIEKMHPSWADVDARLRALDGEQSDGIVLGSPADTYMGISGGENNRYIVAGYLEGFGSYIIASGDPAGDRQDVVICNDYAAFPSRNIVGLEEAILAARSFFETGQLTAELKWEKQS